MPVKLPTREFKFTWAGCLLIALCAIIIGCGKKTEVPPPPRVFVPAPAPTPVVVEQKEKPVYVYSGDRYRDIFTPAGTSTTYQAEGTFDPQKLSVRGIIYSPRYKSAVMSVSGSGTYFVKSGLIFDVMGKAVKGFTAKVLVDRVIVMNESDNVFEIKLKNDSEEAKTL